MQVTPPLSSAEDKAALWQALADGTLEGVVSDHRPEPLSGSYTPDTPVRFEGLMPGTVAKATARHGECLAGTAPITLVEGDNNLTVQLEPLRAATVRVEVVDPKGTAVPGAQVTWGREPGGCVPVEPLALDAAGTGKQSVGVGGHTIFVTAPTFTVYTEDITLAAGEDRLVRVVLKPAKVQLEAKRIVILDKVFFDYNSATIQAVSYELLDQVANTLKANPDILLVEVAGHTDSDGNDNFNLELSQRRVEAVLQYLVARGVAPERLVAKGYGESKPVANNRSPDGKAKNRRVEFQILKREGDEAPVGTPPAETPGASLKPAVPSGK
jgi:outer membrane protein OmpA-like peptidoglycan-associated protein